MKLANVSSSARAPRFLAGLPGIPTPSPARFAQPPSAHDPAFDHAAAAPPAPPSAEAMELHRDAMQRVASAVEALRTAADHLAQQARGDAVEIGFLVARKVLEHEIEQDPQAVFALVRSALQRAGESRRISVRLSPEDAALVQSEPGRAALDGITAARIEYFPDPSLQRGDCVVDADFGQVDGRLATRLAEIRRAVDAATEGAA
jgi:flagellar assembly protein FliH